MPQITSHFRLSSVVLWVIVMIFILPVAKGAARKTFALPAGEALTTLNLFSATSGGKLLYSADAVAGVTTNAVQGEFTPREALDRMLDGTGLEVMQSARGEALAIRRKPPALPPKIPPGVPAKTESEAHAETMRLPTFTIRSERDLGYSGQEALSTTRMGVALADLPQSLVVLNKSFLDDVNPTILANALNYVGGAQSGTINWSVDRYMIRGFVGEGDYVDGFRTQTDRNTDLNLVDHIEIIKGPSAIFIANQGATVGGVINKISKSPTDYRVGAITVQVGLRDGNRADLDLGGPVSPGSKLLWRLLVAGQDSKGYYDSTYEKRNSFLPMLAYKFSDATEAWIKFESFESRYSSYNGIPLDGRTNQIAAVPIKTNFDEAAPLNWRTDRFTRLWGQFTTRPAEFLAIRFAAFDSYDTQRRVESILSPVGATTPTLQPDGTFAFAPFAQYVIPPTYVSGQSVPRTVTAINSDYQPRREFQNDYVFSFRTGPVSHRLLVGGDLIDYPETTRTYSSGSNSTASTSEINPFDPLHPGTIQIDFDQPPANLINRSQTFAKAYVLETASVLKNRVILSFGATRNRFALSSISTNYNQNTAFSSVPVVAPETLLYKNLLQHGIVLKLWPNVSLFYGYNKNFSANLLQFGQFLPPQEGTQREIGLKSDWADGRVHFSANHFEVTQLNNSVPAFPQTTPPSQILVPGTVSRGWDGDFTLSLNKNLDIVGSFALMQAHVPLPAPWNLTPQPYDGRIYQNLPVNNVSQHNFAAWTHYKFTAPALKGLSVGVGVSYLAKRAITDNANLIFYGYVPTRTLVDMAINYETTHCKYQLNIDNLFDRNYIYSSRSNQVIVPGSPTNLRASVTYKF
ncbi:MAG: secretin and TonB N-terminal domain-containing protein [Lacunisphaera sp.]